MATQTLIRHRWGTQLDLQVTYDDVTNQLSGASCRNATGRPVTVRVTVPIVGTRTFVIPVGTFTVTLPAGIHLVGQPDGRLGLDGLHVSVG